jgi:predicted RND superfamily exporter protein
VVAAGFMILGLSQFPPHIKLGYFVATYMVVACVAALVILPVTFAFFHPKLRGAAEDEP